ncbi:MAG TPA: S8 family peptidase, partial [Pyrinomonadaceae bacterium]|nr:S8 family peptidase [Pyrinomonadaceae bacterium]
MSHSPQAPTYRVPVISLLLFAGLFLFAVIALPRASRATRALPQTSRSANGKHLRPEFVPGHVLVRYKDEAAAKRQQKTMTALSVAGRSIPVQIERFDASDMVAGLRLAHVAAEDTMNAIQALKARSDVLYAEPDFIMHADLTPNDPQFASLYGLTKIGAPTAWNTSTGSSSVVVGVIDEGIDVNHPDLQANIWVNPSPGAIAGFPGDVNGWNFINNTGSVFGPSTGYVIPCKPGPPPSGNNCDETDSHATHVAGTIGAVGNNNVGVVGVNWNVRLMSLKFLGPGGGISSDALRAMSYAKAQRDLFISSGGAQGANVRVLNNSYGGGGFTQAFLDGINAINQSGILFVAAAGNDGRNNDTAPHYPSSYKAPNVIAVAWTDQNDDLHPLSNFGQQSVYVSAPGSSILSTTPTSTYDTFSGTSMASPHVAGSAALLLAKNPNLTVAQVKSLLIFNGDVVATQAGKTFTGRRLNVGNSFAALASNDTTPPGAVTNFHESHTGRSFDLGWTASGGDGAAGQAALYQLSFTDAVTGKVVQLQNVVPAASGTPQTLTVKVPYGHTDGTITLREFDNVG